MVAEGIKQHPFFAGMSDKHIASIAECAQAVQYEGGKTIFREGDTAREFYIIKSGKVAIEMRSAANTVIIQTLDEGDVLGWSWIVPPYTKHFDARAVELTRLIAVDGGCLREKCEEDHDLGYELLKRFTQVITDRLQATRIQLADMYKK